MKYLISLLLLMVITFATISARADSAYQGVISDFHSHVKAGMELKEIITIMDENKVDAIVLMRRDSKRFDTGTAPLTTDKELVSFHKKYPSRVYLGVGMQLKPWMKEDRAFMSDVNKLAKSGQYSLIGEAVLFDDRRSKVKDISPQGKNFTDTLKIAVKYKLPVLVHTFNKIGSRENELMQAMRENKKATIVWAHMCGFSKPERIKAMFDEFPNLYCDLAYLSKPQYVTGMGVVDEDYHFTSQWKQLIEAYPNRFLVGVDVTTKEQYREEYALYVSRIRIALGDLSPETAQMVATDNFHRLLTH